MSDKSSDTSTGAPGAAAGDAAHTTQIPRISREPQQPAVAKKAPAPAPSAAKPVEKPAPSGGQTDKGRPRPPAAKGTVTSSSTRTPTKTPAKTPAAKPANEPKGRPLTASDYARTTSASPSSTAVIPAVKSDRQDNAARKPAAAPASQPSQIGSRAATLRLSHVEPWSVTRMAFAISVAMMVVSVVAVTIFWIVLEVTGIWDQIDGSVTSVLSDDSSSFSITDYLGFGRLVGLSLVLSALNVVIMTVLATIGAHLYNLAAQLMGGFEVTYTSQD